MMFEHLFNCMIPRFPPSHKHTHCQLLSICALCREAMKVCNDATWQPIKPQRDEDAIRLSSTLEPVPKKQMEGAKGEEVYFWRETTLFRMSGWFLCRRLTWYQMIERWWWLLCVISCVIARPTLIQLLSLRDEPKMKFPSKKVSSPLQSLHLINKLKLS